MSALPHPLRYGARDSVTMFRRDLTHALRYPLMTVSSICVPVLFLLLFAGVFGGTLRAGLGAAGAAGRTYIDYLTPGILVMTASASAESTAVAVSVDMTEGIISRFRTMPIARASVLTGMVLGSLVRMLASAIGVTGVAFALGFRTSATVPQWIAAAGLFLLLGLALTWLATSFGLLAKTPAGANSLSLILVILPFVSSAFVPTSSMPAGVRWFAQNQPFTPVIQTLRGLLTGTPIGSTAIVAAAWCAGLAAAGYLWARSRYDRGPAR
ncbi:MAG: ABC transporter permease [Streptosporangiaceae bacterium]